MTGKADFTQQEWELVLEGPPSAAVIVVTAQRGGTIRETLAIAKAYVEARRLSGQSELLDELVAGKPEVVHARYHSPEELEQHVLQHLRDAIALLERKASPDEVEAYRQFVLTVVKKVASAHREGGSAVSDAEQAAIDKISANLSTPAG
jgi:2-succinyl-5-enolpyruvyl-6-hydroxy-3-cyclohexene-1-carboxylate synthase